MKIAFTACMDAERVRDQPVWDRIRGEQPDVLMLLGDQVYMDWGDLGASGWRKAIRREPVKGLEAFAVELHRRYALQWEVASFRALVTGFAGRADPSRLLVTWDDHDYAWNNSLGVDGEDEKLYRHGVPPKVKAASRRLFDQFLLQLRTAPASAAYPPLPSDWNQPLPAGRDQGLFWQGALNAGQGPECLLLDTRWHREARVDGASILGAGQRESLDQALRTTGGLLLVAGGTPMSCKYLFSQQAWHGLEEPSYVEYDEALGAARRPVLYIGGDVHRNVWSGRLRSTQGHTGEVVQVLSSGAAIGRIGPKRFAPSFGVLNVAPGWATGGVAQLSLWAQDKSGQWRVDPPTPPLPFDAARWTAPLEAEAASLVDGAADGEPLTILAARVRAGAVQPSVSSEKGLEGLDGVYGSKPIDEGRYPEPLLLRADPAGSAILAFQGNAHQGQQRVDEITALVRDAFVRAAAAHKSSVVLFIHGFGKSFVDAAAQAYQLRASFPACEPILYAWEAGRSGGAVAALTGVPRAQQAARQGWLALSTVLGAFNLVAEEPAFAALAKVVVARSAGSLAMHEALMYGGGELKFVDRVVLSAPLLQSEQFDHVKSFAGLKRPLVITRNRNDQTLKFANWIDGFGSPLGLDGDFHVPQSLAACADFTGCPGVGRLHDYLMLDISEGQRRLNQALLTQRQFSMQDAEQAGWVQAAGPGVFNVR